VTERPQVRTPQQILESLVSQNKGAVSPFGALHELVKQNAATILDPDYCDELVEMLLASGREVLTSSETADILKTPDVSRVVIHPAFIRAGARRGYSFYIASDGTLQRQTHAGRTNPVGPLNRAIIENGIEHNFFIEPTWFPDLVRFIENDQPVLLIGPGGSGKSEAVERAFIVRQQPLQIVSCNPSMTADDFEGRIDLRGGETIFTPSPCAVALREGHGVLLDEADALNPDACFSLYRVLDGKDMRVIRDGLCRSVVERHKNFRIVGTQNTVGRGDETGLYHGRSLQDEPFIDRWANYINVDFPAPEVETLIITKRTGLSKKQAERIVRVATELRKALANGDVLVAATMRRTQAAARNVAAGHPPAVAWQYALQNRAVAKDAQIITELVNRVYGQAAKKPPTP